VKRGADSSSLLNESTDSSAVETVSFFTKYATNGSPFDFQTEEDEGEDVLELNGVCTLSLIWLFLSTCSMWFECYIIVLELCCTTVSLIQKS
jgi:hypothetical protein